jgi:COP9 signalosome complex subunit 3
MSPYKITNVVLQVASIPKYTSSVVHRHIKNAAQAYQELATAYLTHSTEDVQKCISANAETFQKEGNLGLAKQVLRALFNANIKRHTQTYLTLSLHDIADSTKIGTVGEVETTLLRMIEENEIFANINQKDGMVAFQEDQEHYNTNKMLQHMDAQITKAIYIERKLKLVDDFISLNPNYVQRVCSLSRVPFILSVVSFTSSHSYRSHPLTRIVHILSPIKIKKIRFINRARKCKWFMTSFP